MGCQRTGYENTTTQAKPEKKRTKRRKNVSRKPKWNRMQMTQGYHKVCYVKEKHTNSRRTDSCRTDGATRKSGRCQHKDGVEGEENNKQERQGQTQEGREKREHRTPWVPVSTRKLVREPCHTLCRLLPALANNGAKCQYRRCRPPPPPIAQLNKKQTNIKLLEFKG